MSGALCISLYLQFWDILLDKWANKLQKVEQLHWDRARVGLLGFEACTLSLALHVEMSRCSGLLRDGMAVSLLLWLHESWTREPAEETCLSSQRTHSQAMQCNRMVQKRDGVELKGISQDVWETDTKGERECGRKREKKLSAGSLPQGLQRTGLDQVEAESQVVHSCFQRGCCNCLSQYLCLPGCTLAGSWPWGQTRDLIQALWRWKQRSQPTA